MKFSRAGGCVGVTVSFELVSRLLRYTPFAIVVSFHVRNFSYMMVIPVPTWYKRKSREGSERRFRRRIPSYSLVLLTLPFIILALGAAYFYHLYFYLQAKEVLNPENYHTPQSSRNDSHLLMVVLAIPNGYPNIAKFAAKSHAAYARRHGYRLHLETHSESGDLRSASLQKLLACRRARKNEKYVLVLDYDVVIAPWAPPIHLDEGVLMMKNRAGIVDESQPSDGHIRAILLLRNGHERDPTGYYRGITQREGIYAVNGILNSGVLLLQPEFHGDWFEKLYHLHLKTQIGHPAKFHYEQAIIGAELMMNDYVQLLDHAWNRIWVWYNWSETVGFEKYEIGEVFRRSYFLHFCWAKVDIAKLENWMITEGITFEPREYVPTQKPAVPSTGSASAAATGRSRPPKFFYG